MALMILKAFPERAVMSQITAGSRVRLSDFSIHTPLVIIYQKK
jgi:hypothetical protein